LILQFAVFFFCRNDMALVTAISTAAITIVDGNSGMTGVGDGDELAVGEGVGVTIGAAVGIGTGGGVAVGNEVGVVVDERK
jgi:hypothetical protein